MRRLLFIWGLLVTLCVNAQTDSTRVVALLQKGAKQPTGICLPLFYAEQLKGTPYVASTLEINQTEQLVVNLRQLDCTTLIETCVALGMTTHQHSTKYEDYCQNLAKIRYRMGKRQGYASRNHYFTQWIKSNEQLGIVKEITSDKPPFIATQHIDLHFMSQHPHLYPMMKNDSIAQKQIRQYEKEASGVTVRYIPRDQLNGRKKGALGIIHDGDILAIVTKKDGLDTSHLGFAKWGKDGKLHLLNASQIHKKVVLEPMTLYQYMSKHPSQLGIRVIRVTNN